MLENAQQMAIANGRNTVAIIIFKPGKAGRKTANSVSTIRYVDQCEEDLIFELAKPREEPEK